MKEKEYYIKALVMLLRQLDSDEVRAFYVVAKRHEKAHNMTRIYDTTEEDTPQMASL